MEENGLYRPILRRAWQITKKHSQLWFFGLFVSIMAIGGEYEIIYNAITAKNYADDGVISSIIKAFISGQQTVTSGHFWQNLWQAITISPIAMLILFIIFVGTIAVALFFIWLSVVSQISLIQGTSSASKNKKISINEAIGASFKNFWQVLGVNLIFKFVLWLILFLLSQAVFIFVTKDIQLWQMIIYYVIFIICSILILAFSFLMRYQTYFIILKKQDFKSAFVSGWNLIKKNWLISLEIALIVFAITFIALLISVLVGIFMWSIIVVIIPMFFADHMPVAIVSTIYVLLMIILISSIVFINAFINTFVWSIWTLLFNKITGGEEQSKLERIGQSIPNFIIRR